MGKSNWSGRIPRGVLVVTAGVVGTTFPAAPAFASTIFAPTDQSITTVAGNGTAGPKGDGLPAVAAQLHNPDGVAFSLAGTLYISDRNNNRIRKVVNPNSIGTDIISTVAGNGRGGFSGDRGPATLAELNRPSGVALDSSGDLFIADTGNNRVREVRPSGQILTVAGSGRCGRHSHLGDGGPAVDASLCGPTGVVVDGSTLYISDTGHSEVRVVNQAGTIRDFAGTGRPGYSGDGRAATRARLDLPTGLAVAANHTVLIADSGESVVREVLSTGVIRTFAGIGRFGFSGDGGPATRARLSVPTGVGVDGLGDVYIADTFNNRLRKVNAAGIISTAAGSRRGFSGDGGPATSARLASPSGTIAVNGNTIYFADTGNQRIRGIFTGPPPVLPETQWVWALPLSALALGGAVYLVWRRRGRCAAAIS
jgi:sugar lactone lactonase YvrE